MREGGKIVGGQDRPDLFQVGFRFGHNANLRPVEAPPLLFNPCPAPRPFGAIKLEPIKTSAGDTIESGGLPRPQVIRSAES